MRLRNRISPIQINKGSAAKDQSDDVDHKFVDNARSMGAVEKINIPTIPDNNKDTATHTPKASDPINVPTMRSAPIDSCIIILVSKGFIKAGRPTMQDRFNQKIGTSNEQCESTES